MNLRDALICIDCDEVFSADGASCNPRCPACASSVFVPLSAWVGAGSIVDCPAQEVSGAADHGQSARRVWMEIVRSTPAAA